MERIRKPFQGISNIIRFNWHLYGLSLGVISALLALRTIAETPYKTILGTLVILIAGSSVVSLLVSYFVYDRSNLYTFSWLESNRHIYQPEIVNIHAGFDETSAILQNRFPAAHLHVFDFYNPNLHTEVSIKRARKAYPPYPTTQAIETTHIPLQNQTADYTFLILAAHEIRNEFERILFFKELNRILKPSGQLIVVEHLRDASNFLAYNIGFFHFLPKSVWKKTFKKANLSVYRTQKLTPFIHVFFLMKDEYAT